MRKGNAGDGKNMVDSVLVAAVLVMVVMIIVLVIMSSAIVIIKPNERGLYFRMGRFVGVLSPGMNFTTPLISEIKRVDTSMQSFTLSFDNLQSSSGTLFALKMTVHYQISDPNKALLETPSYTDVVRQSSETSIRLAARSMDQNEIWANSNRIRETLRTEIEKTASRYGIAVSLVELSP
jgi:regulator of protease activity HflC (stomatin/prohibitin superfamily)